MVEYDYITRISIVTMVLCNYNGYIYMVFMVYYKSNLSCQTMVGGRLYGDLFLTYTIVL